MVKVLRDIWGGCCEDPTYFTHCKVKPKASDWREVAANQHKITLHYSEWSR